MGGSHFSKVIENSIAEAVPSPSKIAPDVYRAFHTAIQAGLVKSAHDLSEGGLAVCAAEMCIGGRLGMKLNIEFSPYQESHVIFGETNGCLLAEITPEDVKDFCELFSGLPIREIGLITSDSYLKINQVTISVAELVKAWSTSP